MPESVSGGQWEKVSGNEISCASPPRYFFNTRSLSLHFTRTIIPTCRCSVAGLDDLDLDLGLNTVASFRHSATKSWFPAKILPIFKQTTFDELSLTDLAATNRLRMPKINMFQEKINKYRFVCETNKMSASACARNCESMMMVIIKCAERWGWNSAIKISDKRCDKREGEEGIFEADRLNAQCAATGQISAVKLARRRRGLLLPVEISTNLRKHKDLKESKRWISKFSVEDRKVERNYWIRVDFDKLMRIDQEATMKKTGSKWIIPRADNDQKSLRATYPPVYCFRLTKILPEPGKWK